MSAMTEKQASKKWCPMYRLSAGSPDTSRDNRTGTCIGSSCMAWRWTEPLVDGPNSYQSEPKPEGYCGLAGRPVGPGATLP
jgi:hypothetical protein